MRQFTRFTSSRLLALAIAGSALVPAPPAAAAVAPTPVYRYFHPTESDWVSVPDGGEEASPGALAASGYSQVSTPQFYAYLVKPETTTAADELVPVWRVKHEGEQDWVTFVLRNQAEKDLIASWGYNLAGAVFQYWAFASQDAQGTRSPVYRWHSNADSDWITLRQDEISDAQMIAWGYTKSASPLFYAPATKPASSLPASAGAQGYFPWVSSTPSNPFPTTVLDLAHSWANPNTTNPPHTMSVVDRGPQTGGNKRYVAFIGHTADGPCGGIGRSESDDLNNWTNETLLISGTEERWASAAKLSDGTYRLVYNRNYCSGPRSIVMRTRANDDLAFGSSASAATETTLVQESGVDNDNPTLFVDGSTLRLYWHRWNGESHQIRVKTANSIGVFPSGIGDLVASSYSTVAAPQVMKVGSTYYLAVETLEGGARGGAYTQWATRILKSSQATTGFSEIPGNPILRDGSACWFQHPRAGSSNRADAYYCKETAGVWTVDHRVLDTTSPIA